MTKRSAELSFAFDARRANLPQVIGIVIALSLVVGMLLTNSFDATLAYLLVTSACAVPIGFWIYSGAESIPILPAIAAVHFMYFGIPILRNDAGQFGFEANEILAAAATVALFLFVSTVPWALLVAVGVRRANAVTIELISKTALERFIFIGLLLGVFYYCALFSGILDWLGPNFGLIRAIALTSATVACFVLGYARARGYLQRRKWIQAVALFIALVFLSMGSLFLVSAIMFSLAAVCGYVIASKRLPWIFVAIALPTVIILHAGKDDMRIKYWASNDTYIAGMSLVEIPALTAEWMETGLANITTGEHYESAIDRASLLTLLMRVQRLAPDYVPFLEGKSYAVLPKMLVPRFIAEDKISSQAAMKMLNVYFGIQSQEDTASTAVGWGLITEAYGNFGYLGVIGIALALGLVCGAFERMSEGAPLMSLPALVAIAAMLNLINIEGDAAGVLTSLFQSVVAIWILFSLLRVLSKRKGRVALRRPEFS